MNTTMKKMMMILAMMLTIATSASAMTYAEARHEALFLTDKMAFELDLTDYQYEQVYLINLEYMRNIDRASLFGNPWTLRNRQLADVLTARQYRLYEMANYFYRPVSWTGTNITFHVYTRYNDRHHYYRPAMRQTIVRRTGQVPTNYRGTTPSNRQTTTPRTGTVKRTGNVNSNVNSNPTRQHVTGSQPNRTSSTVTRTQPTTRGGANNTPHRTGNTVGHK